MPNVNDVCVYFMAAWASFYDQDLPYHTVPNLWKYVTSTQVGWQRSQQYDFHENPLQASQTILISAPQQQWCYIYSFGEELQAGWLLLDVLVILRRKWKSPAQAQKTLLPTHTHWRGAGRWLDRRQIFITSHNIVHLYENYENVVMPLLGK